MPAFCDLLPIRRMQLLYWYSSKLLRCILGDPVVDAVVAVRQLEHERYGDLDPAQLADKFRMAWSV